MATAIRPNRLQSIKCLLDPLPKQALSQSRRQVQSKQLEQLWYHIAFPYPYNSELTTKRIHETGVFEKSVPLLVLLYFQHSLREFSSDSHSLIAGCLHVQRSLNSNILVGHLEPRSISPVYLVLQRIFISVLHLLFPLFHSMPMVLGSELCLLQPHQKYSGEELHTELPFHYPLYSRFWVVLLEVLQL